MQDTGTRSKVAVSTAGRGVVGHASGRLLAGVADLTGLTGACSDALAGLRQRRGVYAPSRVAVDLAGILADGGAAISNLATLRNQAGLFGPVASDPTAWATARLVDTIAATRTGRHRMVGKCGSCETLEDRVEHLVCNAE